MTQFLTFKDEAEAQSVLSDYYIPATDDTEAYWITAGIGWALNVLGVVVNSDGVVYDGYGVNWSGELPEYLQEYSVEIENPVNVFA